jgi:hypothetical protein
MVFSERRSSHRPWLGEFPVPHSVGTLREVRMAGGICAERGQREARWVTDKQELVQNYCGKGVAIHIGSTPRRVAMPFVKP